MKKHIRRHRADGGNVDNVSARQITQGKPSDVRTGSNAKSITMGMPNARRGYASGGHATDMGFEAKGERQRKSIRRNDILGMPYYAKGGTIHQGMRAIYEALHSHFENEPQMKKLGATKEQVYDGEPHRYCASGGHMWMQKAFNPAKKGALHRALGVPQGKKIPMSKIEQAEHSKSPLLRKRANLAETANRISKRRFQP